MADWGKVKTGKIHGVDDIVDNHAKVIVFNKIHQIGRKQKTLFLAIRSNVFWFRYFQNKLLVKNCLGVLIYNILLIISIR